VALRACLAEINAVQSEHVTCRLPHHLPEDYRAPASTGSLIESDRSQTAPFVSFPIVEAHVPIGGHQGPKIFCDNTTYDNRRERP